MAALGDEIDEGFGSWLRACGKLGAAKEEGEGKFRGLGDKLHSAQFCSPDSRSSTKEGKSLLYVS
jgi:hypothetical protein